MSNPRRTGALTPLDTNVRDGLKLKSSPSLRKGATFQSLATPPSSPPSLPRRSQTNLDDVVGAHLRRAALNIGKFEDRLAAIDDERSLDLKIFRDDSLPVPRGFLNHTVMVDKMAMESSDSERRVLRPRMRRSSNHHESDSGLGSSIVSSVQKRKVGASAITRSVNTSRAERLPRLSSRAINRIHEHTLKPLLAKSELKDFHPIVLDCPRRIQENQIVCLRDLEKTLIFMAPVSQLLKDSGVWGVTYRLLCLKERTKSAKLYLDFCTTSIRCIQATVEYLSDREQTRPHDRPYNSGYFIDLIEQIRQHAQQIRETRERLASGEEPSEMDVDPYVLQRNPINCSNTEQPYSSEQLKLVGGIATTGRPAEIVRVKKNGKAVSIRTGEIVEDMEEPTEPVRFKRSMSQQAEDEDEIMRSMARRKKNPSPEELAPKKCTHPGCSKEFKRACDLTKHEKTHSRPWKCPIPTCKYHEYGWPTEKEMARHVNDKHSAAPEMFECQFKPCPYKSKRESNCKQHMEKAHGWTYKRSKAPKTMGSKAGSSKPTPLLNNLPTPSSDHTDPILTPPEDTYLPTFEDNQDLFPTYPSTEEFNAAFMDNQPFESDISLDFSPIESGTPSTDAGQFNTYEELSPDVTAQFEDIYGAHVRLPTPTYSVYNKTIPEAFTNFNTTMCPPVPEPHFSPSGHGNTMLYTPISMVDIDEGFDDFNPAGNVHFGGDFTLFPSNDMGKSSDFDPTPFGTVPPSMTAGYTQPQCQDFNIDFNMDWTSADMQGFPNH
ncbi:hypothetical protein F5B22DRAFT_628312 [Xylaria bambusicola]|uniref:uncharacterized protein n=1 Tax=Xylaria bambusicola TaxID=326684 RepID=UPI0020082209|nr:uncharacterized protein F5B22DRAFT_628312 [Xylaria bambusicola]KAI0505240.1 hypothetical protein F5B22DRAFT_628312 [Xylaria bambusicola]